MILLSRRNGRRIGDIRSYDSAAREIVARFGENGERFVAFLFVFFRVGSWFSWFGLGVLTTNYTKYTKLHEKSQHSVRSEICW